MIPSGTFCSESVDRRYISGVYFLDIVGLEKPSVKLSKHFHF